MKILLTPRLLNFLIKKGYKYCLSKTTCIESEHASVSINLTPVKKEPNLKRLPKSYDTYFDITDEPKQMAAGVDDTLVVMKLVHSDMIDFNEPGQSTGTFQF
jgi:hypothetical protein